MTASLQDDIKDNAPGALLTCFVFSLFCLHVDKTQA